MAVRADNYLPTFSPESFLFLSNFFSCIFVILLPIFSNPFFLRFIMKLKSITEAERPSHGASRVPPPFCGSHPGGQTDCQFP